MKGACCSAARLEQRRWPQRIRKQRARHLDKGAIGLAHREHADPAWQGVNEPLRGQAGASHGRGGLLHIFWAVQERELVWSCTIERRNPAHAPVEIGVLARLATNQCRNFSKREPPTSLEEEGGAHATLSVAMASDAVRMSSRRQTGRTASDRRTLSGAEPRSRTGSVRTATPTGGRRRPRHARALSCRAGTVASNRLNLR